MRAPLQMRAVRLESGQPARIEHTECELSSLEWLFYFVPKRAVEYTKPPSTELQGDGRVYKSGRIEFRFAAS